MSAFVFEGLGEVVSKQQMIGFCSCVRSNFDLDVPEEQTIAYA